MKPAPPGFADDAAKRAAQAYRNGTSAATSRHSANPARSAKVGGVALCPPCKKARTATGRCEPTPTGRKAKNRDSGHAGDLSECQEGEPIRTKLRQWASTETTRLPHGCPKGSMCAAS